MAYGEPATIDGPRCGATCTYLRSWSDGMNCICSDLGPVQKLRVRRVGARVEVLRSDNCRAMQRLMGKTTDP